MGDSGTQAAPPPVAGGVAILARLRAQRAAAASTAPATPSTAPVASAPAATAVPAAAPAVEAPAAPAAASAAASAAPLKTGAALASQAPAADGVTSPKSPASRHDLLSVSPPAQPAAATGGAAILARLRAQRAAKSAAAASSAPKLKELVVLYASQTGTASEIAKNIQAEAEQKGFKGRVASMNEFGFENLTADKAPVVVYVAASTGDGDSPDNAAKFYATLRRKSQPGGLLAGIAFTGFGLGDSNYTRYQHVPRAIKQRFLDLGATQFYPVGEADEVDGIEEGLDKWLQGLWPALRTAVQPVGAEAAAPEAAAAAVAAPAAATAAASAEPAGVPPLPRCRVRLVWKEAGSKEAESVRSAEAAGPSDAELAYRDPEGQYDPEQPFWAPVTEARYLTTEASHPDRQVLHLELDISGSGMRYSPGDSIGVLPQNDPQLVDKLLESLGLDGNAVFHVAPAGSEDADSAQGGAATANGVSANGLTAAAVAGEKLLPHLRAPCSVRAAFTRGLDLTGPPRKSLLRLLAEHCSEAGDRRRLLHLCSRDGRQEYARDMLEGRPSLLQLLDQFPSSKPPLDALLDALPPLAARMYSLSCSPLEHPDRVQVAFTVVRYSTQQYGQHDGTATTWLHRLCEPVINAKQANGAAHSDPAAAAVNSGAGDSANSAPPLRLPIFLRRGGAFGPPASLATPLIMIGPGTGVTPFRGFLQHRRAQLAAAGQPDGTAGEGTTRGAAWLYFGCRRQDHDYLYREDLESFLADGTLDRLHVAFSRAQQDKVYVQHLMQRHAAELHELIASKGAHVYLCGDGAGMAKDVHACLLSILQQQGGLSEAQAAEQLAEMTRAGRYVRDIWS